MEWGVRPKAHGWGEILDSSIAGFEERRTAP